MTPLKGTQYSESRFKPLLLWTLISLIAFIACAGHVCAGESTFAPVLPADIKISADGDVSNFHDLVFDGSRYVSVWTSREPGKIGIQGQFIGTDGMKGASFLIPDNDAATSPKIALAGNGILVVYYTNNGIFGAVVDSGGHVGPIIPICTAENTQSYPEVIAGGSNLLVVWQDARTYGSTGWDIYGRFVSSSGTLVGNDFRIGPSQGTQSFPIGSFNGEDYVVIWTQEATVNSVEKDLYGARVSQTGIVIDTNGFGICTASGAQTTLNTDCTAGPNGAIALAWTDARTNPVSLYWTTVSREGVLFDGSPSSSGRLVFQDLSYPPGYPSITYNGRDYVIFFGSKSRIIASLIGTDGVVPPLQRVPVIYGTSTTRTACAFDGTNYLVSWATFSSGQIFAQLVTDANQVPIAEAGIGSTFEADRGSGLLDGSLSTDLDGDIPLTYSWTVVSKPANSYPSLKGWNAQQASFTTSVPGQYVYELTVTDAHGAVGLPDRVSFTVTPFTNRPPVLDPIGPRTVAELQQLVIHLSGSDPDGDPIEFGVASLPTGAVFDKATATFTWTPTATQAKIYYIQFWIRDSTGTYTRETVTITVLDANRSPVLTAVGDRTVDEGQLLEILLSGTDPDGTALTYSATDVPAGAALTPATGRFIWTPGYDQAGDYPVTFSVSDGTNSDTERIVIHVIDRDITPPAITVPATPVPDADGKVVVGVGDAVSATYRINDASPVSLVPSGGVISIPGSAFEATGTYTVTVTATDAAGNTATSPSFTVTVDRTPPTILPPEPLVTCAAGGSATVPVGDAASATYQIDNGEVRPAEIADHMISIPAPAAEGTYIVLITATDAAGNGATTSFEIVVPHLNRPPVLEALGDRTVNEGRQLRITVSASDPDTGDTLTYSASNLPPGAALDPVTRTFTWTPSFAQAGAFPGVTFRVTDGGGLSDSEAITITVDDINRDPVFAAIVPQTVNENQPLEFMVSAADPDGDPLFYTAINLPVGAAFASDSRRFSWTPTFGQEGAWTVTFSVTDGTGTDTQDVTITVDHVNRPPVLDALGPRSVNEGEQLEFMVSGSDPDAGDALTYSATDLPSGAIFDQATKTFSWVPGYNQAGGYAIMFGVSDGSLTATEAVSITVDEANRAPVLGGTGPKRIAEGQRLSFTLDGTDPDGDPLAWSASHLPSGAAFDPTTRTFTWTPSFAQAGTYPGVRFEVSDGTLSDLEEITITVDDVNSAPVLAGIGDRAIAEGQRLQFTVSASDAESSTLAYAASNLPSGAVFDSGTRLFTWTPAFTQAGSYADVRFQVTDDGGLSAFEAITITVTDLNRPPALEAIGSRSIDEGRVLSFTLTGSDPDGDPLTFETGDLPAGATFTAATRTFSWTPTYAQAGEYRVAFSLSDGTERDTEEIVIRVVDRDITPPTITVPAAPVPDADGTIAVGVGDAVSATYRIESGPEISANRPEGGSIRVPVPDAPGFYAVTVTATDAAGNPATSSFTVTILDTTEPVITAPANTNTVPAGGFAVGATDHSGTPTVAYTVSIGGAPVSSGSGTGSATIPAVAFATTGVYTVTVTATDAARNTATSTFTVSVDATAPVVGTLAAAPNPAPINTVIVVTAVVDDTAAVGSGVASAACALDDGPWLPMSAGDAVFGGTTETVTASLPAFATAGVHSIRIRAADAAGNTAECAEPLLLAVYDPSAGFVTGGGWIASPAGAYTADPSMAGKATFGFVSKYQKGARVPTGETEFQFRTAELGFRSATYEWLVVAGAKAQFKGTGTINGQGDYGFMLTAVDGAASGGGGADRFRIRIWDRSTDAAVYDNQMGAGETADPTTVLGGGSIIIHAAK